MRVLGLDPGTQRTGFGVVSRESGDLRKLASGVLPLGRGSLAERLQRLHAGLLKLLEETRPNACAVEGLYSHRNARSALTLGHARGVCLLAAATYGLEVVEYAPASIKSSVTGHGAADKGRVNQMVAYLLNSEPESEHDASDALAVAICHLEATQPLKVYE